MSLSVNTNINAPGAQNNVQANPAQRPPANQEKVPDGNSSRRDAVSVFSSALRPHLFLNRRSRNQARACHPSTPHLMSRSASDSATAFAFFMEAKKSA